MFNGLNKGGEEMGYKIKEARIKKGMTQEELSEKSGVSRGTICALESSQEKNTSTETLLKLASALNVSIDDIFFA